MRRARTMLVGLVTSGAILSGCGLIETAGNQATGEDELTGEADLQIYSARHYDMEQAFEQFTDETGITVEMLTGSDAELLERIRAEGEGTLADVFMTVDAGNVWRAGERDLLEPIESRVLDEAVPADLRDNEAGWYGLSMRARTVVYNPDAVDPADFDPVDTYAGLGDPQWQGRLCLRRAEDSYTQSLVASLIALEGEDGARKIVDSWMANDAEILPNDIEILDAIADGSCDVGITNHYYLARRIDEEGADYNVDIYWASQSGDGTHVNISGAGVVKHSDNQAQAQEFIEWLAAEGQGAFVHGNHELPVNPTAEVDALVAGFASNVPTAEMKRMELEASAFAELNPAAISLLEEAGYR